MKVYCKNCHWKVKVVTNQGGATEPKCIVFYYRYKENEYTGRKEFEKTNNWLENFGENEKGECSYYKRKWYKFWIK